MSLNSKIKVPLPAAGVTTRAGGAYQYVYKVIKSYRNAKGQPTNDRVAIGKLDPESGMLIPNNRYYEYYGGAGIGLLPSYDSVRAIGATFFIRGILEDIGVADILENVLGAERAQAALTVCIYMACRGNVMEHVLDFCEGYTWGEAPVAPQSASSLFASITHDERMAFFREWARLQQHPQYLAYDVTSFSSYAQGIADTEWGYNRDRERLPQINLGCYLGQQSGLPVFYITYPGSIAGKSHLPYMMAYNAQLGIDDVGFVMDRGFCTTANVGYMHSAHIPFVMGVEIRHKSTLEAIGTVRGNITSMRYRLRQGVFARSVSSRFYGVASTMHVYYDQGLAECQRRDLFRTVESIEEKLSKLEQITQRDAKRFSVLFDIGRHSNGEFTFRRNYDKIDAADSNNGFFCLLSNTDFSSEEVLDIYRRKDVIEKGFDDLKNHLDMKRLRTHSGATADGKLFLAFVSLIAVSHMGMELSDFMKDRAMSKDSVLRELEKIKVVAIAGGQRLMNPLTKTQRTILEHLGLDEKRLNAYVAAY
jgi:transposase